MWWHFIKQKEDDNIITYEYGFETRVVTGMFEYDKKADTVKIIKYADNHTEAQQKADPLPVYLLIKKYGSPERKTIAFG